jgi:hypothetical protein
MAAPDGASLRPEHQAPIGPDPVTPTVLAWHVDGAGGRAAPGCRAAEAATQPQPGRTRSELALNHAVYRRASETRTEILS